MQYGYKNYEFKEFDFVASLLCSIGWLNLIGLDFRWIEFVGSKPYILKPSNEVDKVFCFCCKLFKSTQKTFKFGNEWVNGWHNIPAILREHENNSEHIASLIKWVDLHKNLEQKETIDKWVEFLIEHCMKLETFLKHNEESDICGKDYILNLHN